MESLYLVGIAVLALFAFVLAVVLFNFFGLWLRARIANAPVSLGKMVGMRLRKVPVGLIVDNRITAVKAGLDVRSDPLEAHYLAGGDVSHVVLALIAADKAGISLDFNRACAIDLATKGTGTTVLDAVPTRKYWKTRIGFQRLCSPKGSTAIQRLKFSPSTLPTSMSAIISGRNCKPSRPRQTSASRKRKPRCAGQPRWP